MTRQAWSLGSALTVSSSTDGASLHLPRIVRKTSRKPATSRSGRVNQSRRISNKATGGIQFLPLHPPAQCQNRLRPSVVNVPDHAKIPFTYVLYLICNAFPSLNSPERRKVPLYFQRSVLEINTDTSARSEPPAPPTTSGFRLVFVSFQTCGKHDRASVLAES